MASNRNKKTPPPQPLDATTKTGKPRCQRWKIRDGVFWQCSLVAREGFPVCGSHGAGFPRREAAGTRQHVATGRLSHGAHMKPATAALVFKTPALARLVQEELVRGTPFDFKEELATLRGLRRFLARTRDLAKDGPTDQRLASLLASLGRCIELAERVVSIESKMGPISRSDLEEFARRVRQVILELVPADRQDNVLRGIHDQLCRPARAGA